MFESLLSRRVEENRPRRVSGAVNIMVEFYRRTGGWIPYPILPRCIGVSRTPGDVYRVQVAGRGHPSPPITRSDIQANILPLPVIPSSHVCCKRKVHVRVHVNGAYSVVQPPRGCRESRGKTMPSCLHIRRDPFLVVDCISTRSSVFKHEQNCGNYNKLKNLSALLN